MNTRPFIDTFRHIEGGCLLDDLADQQRQVIEAVRHTHRKGSLTLTLSYTPEGHGQISIEADVKIKAPKRARGKSIFFVTPDANLERNDPRQRELDIQPVADDRPTQFKQAG